MSTAHTTPYRVRVCVCGPEAPYTAAAGMGATAAGHAHTPGVGCPTHSPAQTTCAGYGMSTAHTTPYRVRVCVCGPEAPYTAAAGMGATAAGHTHTPGVGCPALPGTNHSVQRSPVINGRARRVKEPQGGGVIRSHQLPEDRPQPTHRIRIEVGGGTSEMPGRPSRGNPVHPVPCHRGYVGGPGVLWSPHRGPC